MLPSTTCDGDVYLHNLSTFIKSHERQLANALLAYKKQPKTQQQLQQQVQNLNSKPVRLSLTLHHLYYLLERFQDLGISVGPMNIRLDNIHNDDNSLSYVSFLSDFHQNKRMSSDAQSIHSMSSVKSVMSSVSALWTSMGNGSGINSKEMLINDLKYLYSAFTKLPCLRLAPDSRAKLIEGHEEYPFDTLVPLKAFKNLSVLEVCDLNLKEIYGWNIISEQIKFLVLKKTGIVDPVEVLIDLVDGDYQARGGSFYEESPTDLIPPQQLPPPQQQQQHSSVSLSGTSPSSDFHPPFHKKTNYNNKHHLPMSSSYNTSSFYQLSGSLPDTHYHQRTSPTLSHATLSRQYTNEDVVRPRNSTITSVMIAPPSSSSLHQHRRANTFYYQSTSPPSSSSQISTLAQVSRNRVKRSSSNASDYSVRSRSTPTPPPSEQQHIQENKWKNLKHLSFTENNITVISDWSFEPLQSLSSLDLSHNKLTHIPEALFHLKNLKSLNLSYNKLESTQGFKRKELTKLTILNLKSNKLKDLNSLEFLKNLEKLDLRSNKLEITHLKPLLMGTKPLKLQLLFLQNNPMRNYRIEVYNLFNGIDYDNKLRIDGSRPGIFESRLLLDSKNAELKLNKFFISQITHSISSMSLAVDQQQQQPLVTPSPTTTLRNPSVDKPSDETSPSQVLPPPSPYSDKEYVLLPPMKPFMKPSLIHKSSQDTLTSSPMTKNSSITSVVTTTQTNSNNNNTATTMVHSPSLILKSNFDAVKDSKTTTPTSSHFEYSNKSPRTSTFAKATPTSPHASVFPLSDSPRTVSSNHSLASKLNRLSNDLTTIVSTSNNSHELLSHKLSSPLPPVMTLATSTVNNSGNSNSSSQRTSIVSTQVKDNSRNYDEEYNSNLENDDPVMKSNPNINPAILYLINND